MEQPETSKRIGESYLENVNLGNPLDVDDIDDTRSYDYVSVDVTQSNDLEDVIRNT